MVFARYFGTDVLLSAFRIAFMIPNLARRLFGEGALSAAFIPIFMRELHSADADRAPRLAGGVLTLLSLVLGVIVLVGELVLIVTWTLQPSVTLRLTIIMFPFLGLICLAAFLGGLLNAVGSFAAPAASPMLLNVGVIVAVVVGVAGFDGSGEPLMHAVCVAVLISGFAQVGLQLWALRRTKFHPIWNRNWRDPQIREITAFMAPMILGLSTVQFNSMLDKLMAYWFVADGQGPAVLGYAHFLYQLPLGVFGIALATAIFPTMAKSAAAGDEPALIESLGHGIRLCLFVSLPATVGLMLIATPLVRLLFEAGQFGSEGTARVSDSLIYYSLGLCAYSVQHILVRAFYSLRDSRTPVRISMYMVALNVILNLVLVRAMRESGVALATAITAFVQIAWAGVVLSRRLNGMGWRRIGRSAGKTVLASAVMGVVVWLIIQTGALPALSKWHEMTRVSTAVVAGGLSYALAARLFRIDELRSLLTRGRSRTG